MALPAPCQASVLLSAGMELIFFLLAGVGLCFGFASHSTLIILGVHNGSGPNQDSWPNQAKGTFHTEQ